MGIRESLLNTITSVSNSDFVRIVTSAGVSSKATVQNLFKSFETGLGAKSSLTTSDYVRVVGSDDVSYKQPMTDLMSTTGVTRTSVSNNTDLNDLTPNGTLGTGYYRGDNISTMTNKPSAEINSFPWALDAINVNSYIKQILHVYTAQANIVVYERIQRYSSGSIVWGNWEKMPTRAEVDALNSKVINSTSSQTIIESILTLPIGTPCILRFSGEAGTTITGSTAQHGGTAYRADTSIVDMFLGAFGASQVFLVRVTKNAVGDYSIVRKKVDLS